MDNYVKGVKVIEIYDAANKELLVKYDDKHNIDKVISALNIKSWKETEKSIGIWKCEAERYAQYDYDQIWNECVLETIALEDSKNGLLSAYRAGCKPIMVPDLWQPDEEILQIIKGKYSDLEQVKKAFESGEI